MEEPEIKKITLKCKDCGRLWEKHYRKELSDSKGTYWRPSKLIHYCEEIANRVQEPDGNELGFLS